MTDDVPSLGQVELNWQPGKLREAGEVMRAQSEDFLNLTDQMVSHIREVGATWEGDAYWAAYDRIAGDRDNGNRIASEVGNLAQLLISSGDSISSYRGVLLGAVASARESGFRVTERWTVEAAVATADDLGQVLSEHQSAISTALNEMLSAQSDAVSAIEQASREVRAEGDRLGAGDDPTADRAEEEARAAAAAAAFAEIFGRPPVSLTDWETARVLDPNSYDPKYRGVDPEIRVARIDPVTGQGVVRVSQYISQDKVLSVPQGLDDILNPYDLGDNRTEDPNFDPEHTRVATYIDYENGLVVMRQNPTVTAGGDVAVEAPRADVWQVEDGSVRIRYDAKNPFAPDIDSGHTVNGDLVFTPGNDGVAVAGTRTDYPSLEVYQDYPEGETRTVAIDPAKSGQPWGPAANLPFHHDLGSGALATQPFKTYPWSGGELPPPQDLPWTSAGSVDSPPKVQIVTPEYPAKLPTI